MNKAPAYTLPAKLQKIFLALSYAMIEEPKDLEVKNRDKDYLDKISLLLLQFPKLNRFLFLRTVLLFNLLPLFFGFGFKTFLGLSDEFQKKYVNCWMQTKNHFLREAFKGMRGLVMITYFSNHDVWEYIGYDPVKHVNNKIELRTKILGEFGKPKNAVDSQYVLGENQKFEKDKIFSGHQNI